MFEYEELSFCFRYLRTGDHFVDVGANVGIFTVFIGTRVPGVKITSIEPYPPSREMLKRNCSLNQLDPSIISAAAGSVNGEGTLEVSGPDVLHHLVESMTNDVSGIRVSVRMLDDVVGDKEVALVKVDVEGGELEVFRGALRLLGRARPPAWIFELNGRGASPKEIRGMLCPFGYKLYLLDGLFTPYFGNELPTTPNVLATTDLAAVQALVTTSMQAVPSPPVPVTVRYRSS
jgi:FkbM family methyltransferase